MFDPFILNFKKLRIILTELKMAIEKSKNFFLT